MKIPVINQERVSKINVVFNGLCLHNSTHLEDDEFDLVHPYGSDITYKTVLEVCDKCSSYRDIYAEEWQGVHVMPMA